MTPSSSLPATGSARSSGGRKPGSARPVGGLGARPSSSGRPQLAVDVPEGYLAVGRIVGVHGIHGEIKVESYTDYPERFAPGVVLCMGPNLEEVVVESGRPHKGHILLALEEIHDRNTADELRGLWLFVPEEEAVERDEHTFWVHDILGMQVVTDEGVVLGTIADVLFTGANEVYAVQTPEGSEVLLPATDEVVLAVDLEARRMTVHLLPGILD